MRLHGFAGVAGHQRHAGHVERRRAHAMADAGIGEQLPGKFLARILLARRRDVGMRQHALRHDRRVALEDRSSHSVMTAAICRSGKSA